MKGEAIKFASFAAFEHFDLIVGCEKWYFGLFKEAAKRDLSTVIRGNN